MWPGLGCSGIRFPFQRDRHKAASLLSDDADVAAWMRMELQYCSCSWKVSPSEDTVSSKPSHASWPTRRLAPCFDARELRRTTNSTSAKRALRAWP